MTFVLFVLALVFLGGLASRFGCDSRDRLTRDRFIPGQIWLDADLDRELAKELEMARLRRLNDVVAEKHASVKVESQPNYPTPSVELIPT